MKNCKSIGDALRSQFRQKNGSADPQWNRDEQGDSGRDDSPIDERKSAEFIHDGIPHRSGEKMQAKLVAGESGIDPQLVNEKNGEEHHGHSEYEA